MATRLYKHNQFNKWQSNLCFTCYRKPNRFRKVFYGHIAAKGGQAIPHTGFYADILSHANAGHESPDVKAAVDEATKSDDKADRIERAKVVFGSRLLGPAERQDQLDRESKLIAGVLVPPRPSEPDNCCMSGCVNCVWDRYREDLEEWALKSKEARMRLKSQRSAPRTIHRASANGNEISLAAQSMDDDGGGSESNWGAFLGNDDEGDLFKDVPIGIREFMKIEKSLKKKQQMQSSSLSS